jgi:hypothetical protein
MGELGHSTRSPVVFGCPVPRAPSRVVERGTAVYLPNGPADAHKRAKRCSPNCEALLMNKGILESCCQSDVAKLVRMSTPLRSASSLAWARTH